MYAKLMLIAWLAMGSTSAGEAVPTQKQRDAVRKACTADVMRLCPREAAARDRDKARACLKANFSKASDACQASLRDAAVNRPPPSPPKR